MPTAPAAPPSFGELVIVTPQPTGPELRGNAANEFVDPFLPFKGGPINGRGAPRATVPETSCERIRPTSAVSRRAVLVGRCANLNGGRGRAMTGTRKIDAILVADVAGYSRLAGADEVCTPSRLRGLRSNLINPAIAAHHGRIVRGTAARGAVGTSGLGAALCAGSPACCWRSSSGRPSQRRRS